MNYQAFFFVTVLFFGTSANHVPDFIETLEDGETERIVGGRAAESGQFPFACALYFDADFICTCSIISERFILTAAHCVVTEDTERYHVIANVDKSADELFLRMNQNVYVHPNYTSNRYSIQNDIALFEIERINLDVNGEPPVDRLCLAQAESDPIEKDKVIAMGWGSTSFGGLFSTIPNQLRYVKLNVLSNEECTRKYPDFTEKKICAGDKLFKSICSGDSGGPLVHTTSDGQYVQVGVASYQNAWFGCGKKYPGVFTRVSSYMEWILETTMDPTVCVV